MQMDAILCVFVPIGELTWNIVWYRVFGFFFDDTVVGYKIDWDPDGIHLSREELGVGVRWGWCHGGGE